jgi:hypothetical protein
MSYAYSQNKTRQSLHAPNSTNYTSFNNNNTNTPNTAPKPNSFPILYLPL